MSGQHWWLWGNQSYQGNEHWGLWWWQGIFSFQAAKEGFPQDRHWQTTRQQDSSLLRQIWEDGEYDGGGGSSTTSLGDKSRHQINLHGIMTLSEAAFSPSTSISSYHCHCHEIIINLHLIISLFTNLHLIISEARLAPTEHLTCCTWPSSSVDNLNFGQNVHLIILILLIIVVWWWHCNLSQNFDLIILIILIIILILSSQSKYWSYGWSKDWYDEAGKASVQRSKEY